MVSNLLSHISKTLESNNLNKNNRRELYPQQNTPANICILAGVFCISACNEEVALLAMILQGIHMQTRGINFLLFGIIWFATISEQPLPSSNNRQYCNLHATYLLTTRKPLQQAKNSPLQGIFQSSSYTLL